jgi:hypothetical protein
MTVIAGEIDFINSRYSAGGIVTIPEMEISGVKIILTPVRYIDR